MNTHSDFDTLAGAARVMNAEDAALRNLELVRSSEPDTAAGRLAFIKRMVALPLCEQMPECIARKTALEMHHQQNPISDVEKMARVMSYRLRSDIERKKIYCNTDDPYDSKGPRNEFGQSI